MSHSDLVRNEVLVLRAQAGDADAMAQLVEDWQPRLWAFARVRTDDDDTAWDVMQDVWVAVLRDLRRLQEPGRFRQWVFRIVYNKSSDRVRRLVRQRRLLAGFEENKGGETTDNRRDIRDIVASLPEQEGSLLALHYLEEISYEELATILNIPIGTVKSRLHKARHTLRKLLESDDGRL